MCGWSTKGICLFVIIVAWVTVGMTPISFVTVAPVSAKPNVPYKVEDWTYVTKPVLPIQINEAQIPIGSDWTFVYTLEEGKTYRVYCYGEWIDDATETNKTDYDIFVYNPSGDLESYHTESAGLPEHLGTTVDHPFFIPKESGDYSFRIRNDARESNGASAATFMVIEHIETDKWYQLGMIGKVNDQPVEKTSWAYEFNTTSSRIEVDVKVPDTLDMYETRLYILANPSTNVGTMLNGLPLSDEEGLHGKTSGIYGGYNLDSEGVRANNAMASCEYPGEDMLINFTVPVEGNLLYHVAFIAENGEGDIEFMVKTDFDAPELTIIDEIRKANPNNKTTITVNVDEQFNLDTVTLNYTCDNGASYTAAEMAATQNITCYNSTIPGQPAGTLINYTVLARDVSGNAAEFVGSYWVKKSANITLQMSSPVVEYGQKITVTGSTPVSETNVTITYALLNASALNGTTLDYTSTKDTLLNYTSKSSVVSRVVTADSSGTFSDEYRVNKAGKWLVWAEWNGTQTYFGTSDLKKFTAQKLYISVTANITSSITIDENVTITGFVYPKLDNLTVKLILSDSNTTTTLIAHTNENGTYQVLWSPTSMGKWHIHAILVGNDSISEAYSNTSTFTVNDTFLNQYLLYIIGGGGGAGGIGAVMFIRKRREDE